MITASGALFETASKAFSTSAFPRGVPSLVSRSRILPLWDATLNGCKTWSFLHGSEISEEGSDLVSCMVLISESCLEDNELSSRTSC